MRVRIVLLSALLSGCAGGLAEKSNPTTDPANPQAEEAPYRKPMASTKDPLLATEPPPSNEPSPAGGHEGHGGMQHEGTAPEPPPSTTLKPGHKHVGPAKPAPGHEMGHENMKDMNMQATVYTCPMHPEIRENKPGKCPKCGMTLAPAKPDQGTP